jgi:dGTPase
VAPQSLDDVRNAPALVAHSDEVAAQAAQLKRFLFKNLYRHYRVMRMANKAKRVVTGLFEAFTDDPRLLPPAYQARGPVTEESANDAPSPSHDSSQARLIAHYIAGMTDRYALKEYQRLFVIDNN